jgi:hypothetical protein
VDEQEPWKIELGDQYLFNWAGEGAREMEERHAAGKGRFRRAFERAFDVRTDERNWRRGAEGEEEVGRRLDELPRDRWAVIHDLTIGSQGANLDHLVIGPPGVFALNTKHLTGKVTLYDRAILHNGHKTSYVRDSLREARTVQNRLSTALGQEVLAWGVVVLMGCELDVRKRPTGLSVIGRRELPSWFLRMPGEVLSRADVLRLERAARTPATWITSTKPRAASPRPGPWERPEPRSPALASSTTAAVDAAVAREPELVVRRWRRYGHDRLYASLADGTKAGFIDVPTGDVHVGLPQYADSIAARLAEERRKLTR